MEYMGDSTWWNNRFKERKLKLMGHEKRLEDDISYFKSKGKILDVACGDGRNSIYLARLGYDVHAIDFSKEALERLDYFSKSENLNIKTELIDLTSENMFSNLDKYHGIIINHYRLSKDLYKTLMDFLNEDGVLWVNGFREVPADNPNIKDGDILFEDDFRNLEKYNLEDKIYYSIGERKFARYIWRK